MKNYEIASGRKPQNKITKQEKIKILVNKYKKVIKK